MTSSSARTDIKSTGVGSPAETLPHLGSRDIPPGSQGTPFQGRGWVGAAATHPAPREHGSRGSVSPRPGLGSAQGGVRRGPRAQAGRGRPLGPGNFSLGAGARAGQCVCFPQGTAGRRRGAAAARRPPGSQPRSPAPTRPPRRGCGTGLAPGLTGAARGRLPSAPGVRPPFPPLGPPSGARRARPLPLRSGRAGGFGLRGGGEAGERVSARGGRECV